MNPLKCLMLAALAFAAVTSAQDATTTPAPTTTGNVAVTSTTAPPAGADADAPITKEELDAVIAEITALAATDPEIAAVFATIDLEALSQLTPEQARDALNEKVFKATAPPASVSNNATSSSSSSSSGSGSGAEDDVTTPSPTSDAVATTSPAVPAPAATEKGAAASLATASVTALAAGVVVTIWAM